MKKRVVTIISILTILAMCMPVIVHSESKTTKELIIANNVGTITGDDDNPIYSFTSDSGSLTIPQGYKAVVRILVVGGGGSGSSYKSANPFCGLGGEAIEKKAYLTEGSYQITVGNGGESVKFTDDSLKVAGKAGEASSFKGNDIDILALGGAGGTGKSYTNKGLESDITGTFITYGKDPGTTTITIEANSGNGASKVSRGKESLPGQAGVVIVKIESLVRPGEHTFTYSKEGTTLYARCNEGCADGYDESPLELKLLDTGVFGEKQYYAWLKAGCQKPDLVYYDDENTPHLTGVCFDKGTYLAEATVGDVTVSKSFTVSNHVHIEEQTVTEYKAFNPSTTTAGNYCLGGTTELGLSRDYTIPTGVTNLCLNGRNINLKGFQILGSNSIAAKATLNIYDYSQVKRYYTITDDGTWHLQDDYSEGCVTVTGGMITGGSETKGGAINISGPKNRVNLYGGNLFNNKAKESGGAIYAEKFAQFVMEGGAILNNKSTKQGGAINLHYGSSAYIEDGEISYNTSEEGGGAIYVYWEGTDTDLYPCSYLKINGGKISHNITKTSNGGAILTAGKTVITGGVIEYNEALAQGDKKSGRGGGVRISSGDFIMTGGAIRYNKARSGGGIHYAEGTVSGEDFIPFEGSATFGGTATVYGNTIKVYNKDNILEKEGIENLYIADNSDIGGLSGFLTDHISVATGKDAPRKGMNVGINMQSPSNAFAKEVENPVYNTRFFTSDNPNYYVTDWSDGLGLHSYDDLHEVKTINTDHGAVYVDKQAAPLGEIIIVEPCPYNESSTVQVTVTTFDGDDVKIEAQKDGTYTFFMPDTDVVVQAFPHNYVYTLNGNTFTATCIDTPCSKATDPVNLTFELINGKPGFNTDALNFWRSSGAKIPVINYYKNDDLVNPLEEYPTKDGRYVAVAKIDNLEAKIEFLVIDFYGKPITASTNVEYYWDKADLVLIYKDTEKDGTLITPAELKTWILAVGGGGAGGTVRSSSYTSHAGGGGGGAGELLIREKYDLSADAYTITVGKGGTPNGTSEKSAAGGNGKDSSIKGTTLDITVKGGGGGGGESVGSAGGSGGGGSYKSTTIYAGGEAVKNNEDGLAKAGGDSAKRFAGGGGGSASAGQAGQNSVGGNGGAGTKCSITGQEKYYAAGGGGGATNSGNGGGAGGSNIGGIGGKHDNSDAAAPTSGADGTGSGGGGGGRYKPGAAGGSGVVIVRFYGHDYSYSVDKDDKAVLFATCNEIDCSANYDDEPLSLTLTEDGFDAEELTVWLNAKAQQPTIKYYATSDLTTALEGKPTDNGDYVVKATVGTATAEVEFTINNHPHQLTYSLDKDGKTIIATCSNLETECPFENHKITITLSADGGTYDGKTAFVATTDDSTTGFAGATKTTIEIKYYKEGVLLDDEPINAGNYVAKLSLKDGDGNLITDSSGNTIYASCQFTVSKMLVDAPKENSTEFVYDGKDQTYMTIEESAPYKLADDSASLVKSTVGKTTIKLVLKDTDNYAWRLGSDPTYTFTINKATQIITADDKKSFVYEDINKSISATVLDKAQVTYSIKNGQATDVVEIDSNTGELTIKKAGTTIVVVTAAETSNYNSASKEIVVEVAKKKIDKPTENTDTFTYNKSQQTYIPTGFNASTMNITGNQQTVANETGYTVEVTPKENYEFSTAGECKFTWIINKDTVAVPIENEATFTYNGENQSYFTLTGDELYVVKTGVGFDNVTQKDADEYHVTLTLKDTTNYKWATIEKDPSYTFTINKAEYNGIKVAAIQLSAKVNSTVTVQLPELPQGANYANVADGFSYGSSSVMDGELTLTVIGSDIPDETDPFEITVDVTGATNYIEYKVTVTVTPIYHIHDFTYEVDNNVLKATCIEGCTEGYDDNCLTLTLTAPNSLVYDGLSKEVTFISEEKLEWESVGLTVPKVVYYLEDGTTKTFQGTENEGKAPTNAGKYIAKATVDTNKTAVLEYTIAQREITVTITANGGTYSSTITAASASFNNLVGGETVTPVITYTATGYNSEKAPTNAGNYTITVTLPVAATNYKLVGTTTSTFVVEKATVKAPKINSKVYTGETLTADVETSTLYTITTNNGGILAGNYDVVLTLVDADNYKWATTKQAANTLTFTITQADNSWSTTPSIGDVTYGTAINPIGESIFGDVVIQYVGTNGTVYNGLIVPTKAGSYKATFSVVETTSYKGLSKDVEFTISKKQLEVTGTEVESTRVYDATKDANVTNVGTLANLETGDSVTLKATAQYADKNVGENKSITVVYTIEGTDATNYIKPVNNTSLTADITAKQLEVTGTEVESTRVYDATKDANVTNVGTFANLETGDSVTLKATAQYADKNVGENKSITVVYTLEGIDATNYIKPVNNTSLTADITKKDVPLPAKDKSSHIYNGKNLTYRIVDDELYSVSGNVRKNVGKYKVKISLNDKWNYKWENVDSNDLEYSFVIYRTGNAIHDLAIEGWTDTQKGNLPTATADFGEVEFVYSKADIIDFSMTELPTVAGEYIVKAYVVGNDNYASCEDQMPFTINKTVLSDDQIGKSLVKLETDEGFGPNLILKVELVVKADELIARNYQPIVDYKQLAERYEKVAGAYDVRLLLNGKEIQPEDLGKGTIVTAYVSLPEHLKNTEFRFLHVHSKDNIQTINKDDVAGLGTYTINEEGYLVTQIDSLSEFVFFYQPSCSMHWYMIAAVVAYIALFIIFAITKRRKAIFVTSAIGLVTTTILAFFIGCIVCTIAIIIGFVMIIIGTLWAKYKLNETDEEKEVTENN